ncbi:hypothetical protein CRE_08557 [Caenorhabditis remanei]|uniref:Uncharacterized protein n=1 Tax=Caenorhabditis remanei TaxID=31234 RepID=E3NEM5_CAERE|nr:hypothetical protein CRE_08557 [Caenorhabditis remanei]
MLYRPQSHDAHS